ncbi:MAG: hypothetical protein AB3N13_09220 [Arenibacterium sp.]
MVDAADGFEQRDYDAEVYRVFFDHLLQHRHRNHISVSQFFPGTASAHELTDQFSELIASPDDVSEAIDEVQRLMSLQQAASSVDRWYLV